MKHFCEEIEHAIEEAPAPAETQWLDVYFAAIIAMTCVAIRMF